MCAYTSGIWSRESLLFVFWFYSVFSFFFFVLFFFFLSFCSSNFLNLHFCCFCPSHLALLLGLLAPHISLSLLLGRKFTCHHYADGKGRVDLCDDEREDTERTFCSLLKRRKRITNNEQRTTNNEITNNEITK